MSTSITVSLTPLREISSPALRIRSTSRDRVSSPEASMSLMPLATMTMCLRFFWLASDLGDLVFQIAGVGEKQRAVKTDQGDVLALLRPWVVAQRRASSSCRGKGSVTLGRMLL